MATEYYRIVYIYDEEVYGQLVSEGSYVSRVLFEVGGISYDTLMDNNDFELVQDIQIEIEEEC